MTETTATVKPGRKLPAIWLVPVVAVLLGVWMVAYNYMTQGPEITITFATADGIVEGKTKIKMLDVELGVVESAELSKDLQQVNVTAQLERFAMPLLREDTQFWVVRPRIGPGGISGLSTILSGGYIELEAGTGKTGRKKFLGLERPPVTPAGTPGLKIFLDSERAGSVSEGDPILFRGFQVGQIEEIKFDPDLRRMSYTVFVEQPYKKLITASTKFWNASGVNIYASAEGIDLEISSLQTLLVGGVAFTQPEGAKEGSPAKNGDRFKLYPNKESIGDKTYKHYFEMVVAFTQSISGLSDGAPVQYRGIRVGTVQRVLMKELANSSESSAAYGAPIPVLIRFEPGRFGLQDTQEDADRFQGTLAKAVANGLRGSLLTGNIITGQLLIEFDYYPDAKQAEVGDYFGYESLPTLPGGMQRIQEQISSLLAKLNELPLEPVVVEAQATLRELNATLDSFSPDSQNGEQLNRSLSELNRTLRNIDELTRTLSEKPNSIIFSSPVEKDLVPEKKDSP